jgi:hypothetical protein
MSRPFQFFPAFLLLFPCFTDSSITPENWKPGPLYGIHSRTPLWHILSLLAYFGALLRYLVVLEERDLMQALSFAVRSHFFLPVRYVTYRNSCCEGARSLYV